MTYRPHESGFTLIETLVAVALLAVTIVLPYHAIQRSLYATYSARDDLVASTLAQEAIEYVRSIRDNNYIYNLRNPSTPKPWLAGLDTSAGGRNCFAPARCTVDVTKSTPATALAQCPVGGCTAKLYLSPTGFYNMSSTGTATRFIRYIQLTTTSAHEVKVTSTVTWFYHGTHTVTITDIIHDWL